MYFKNFCCFYKKKLIFIYFSLNFYCFPKILCGYKAAAEDQTTLQNQFEYVQNFFANQEKVKVYELNGNAITEVTEA